MKYLKDLATSMPFQVLGGIALILLAGHIMINYNDAYWGNKDSDGNYKK